MSTQYTGLIKTTAQACKSKKTGCVAFRSDSGESGHIFIKAGKIVGLDCGEETGINCLPAIVMISQIDSYEFKEIPVIFAGSGLPDTPALLNALIQRKHIVNGSYTGEVESNSKPVAPRPQATRSELNPRPSAQPRMGLSATQKNTIRDNLMDIIGPMADFLAEEHVDNASSVEEAMLGLGQDIDEDSLAKLRAALSKSM